MSEKTLNGRIILKHDTETNWNKATNFVPKLGELIIYDDLKKMKIGDGTTKVINLPFVKGSHDNTISVSDHSLVITT